MLQNAAESRVTTFTVSELLRQNQHGGKITIERSHYFNFMINFLRNQNLFQKTGIPFLSCENATFPYKTGLSNVNVETNRMENTKWTYHKEWKFATNYFILKKNKLSRSTAYK